jgi:hypothetical protein
MTAPRAGALARLWAYGWPMRRFPPESLGWTAVGWGVAATIVVTEAAMVASLVGRAGEAIEAVSPLTLGVAVWASVLALVGASVLALSRHRDLVLLSATASMLMIVAVLALFSIGILVLPLAVVTFVLLVRRTSGRRGLAVPLLAGPAVAVGLAVLFVIWVQPPLVECHEHGVSGTSRPWWGSGGSGGSGGGEVTPSGVSVATGSIDTPSGRYLYRCEGSTLIEFRRG